MLRGFRKAVNAGCNLTHGFDDGGVTGRKGQRHVTQHHEISASGGEAFFDGLGT